MKPEAAGEDEVLPIHTPSYLKYVKSILEVYEVAVLSVGGAIKTSELATKGDPAFGLIRPTGHHAGLDSGWGFCYFNNVAISIGKLRRMRLIEKAVIIDIDLHYGDGIANAFARVLEVFYHHVAHGDGETFLSDLLKFLESASECDVMVASAGFDRHKEGWGGMLETEDYRGDGECH